MKNNIFSAALSPDQKCFVAGGEDFLIYKFNYENGEQLGEVDSNMFLFRVV